MSCFGRFNTIFRLFVILIIAFKTEAALQSLLVRTEPSDNQRKEIFGGYSVKLKDDDVIHVGDDPKVITLNQKTFLNYSYNPTDDLSFLIIQAHTQYQNLTLSSRYGTDSNTNSDTAILKTISHSWFHPSPTTFQSLNYVLEPPRGVSVQSLVAVTRSNGKAPVPGGCCLTCSMDMDPNLFITSKQYYKSTLSFSVANVYSYNTSDCSGQPDWKPEHYRLKYSIYQYFLEEGNFDNNELFDGISKMLTPSQIKANGNKVRDWNPQTDVNTVVFDTKRGQGIVFNIIVNDPLTNSESAYSPVVTYGCSFTAKVDGCDSLGSIANLVIASCGSLFGLFVCFFGVRFYRLYIVGCGLTLFSFIGFVILTNKTEWSHEVRIIGSVCIGIVGGLLLYLFWWWTGYKYFVLYICGLPFGFLFSALVFFTPFGNFRVWKNDINYWTVFFCISIVIPCFPLLYLKAFAILVSSLVGAYGFIVGIDTFLNSSMSYIILNVIMKATEDDFVKYDIPFQSKDYILSGVWGLLTILGVIVQSITSKGKPVLPNKNPRKKRKRIQAVNHRNRQRPEVTRAGQIDNGDDDPLPILVNSRHGDTTTFEYDTDEEHLPILIEPRAANSKTNDVQQRSTRYGTNVVC